jgi:stress-induced morphogen
MPTAEQIKQRIEDTIQGASADVEDYTGGGDHFRATVTAPAFAGLSRVEQHRLVYEIFGKEIGGPIHALSLKTQATAAAKTRPAPASETQTTPGSERPTPDAQATPSRSAHAITIPGASNVK